MSVMSAMALFTFRDELIGESKANTSEARKTSVAILLLRSSFRSTLGNIFFYFFAWHEAEPDDSTQTNLELRKRLMTQIYLHEWTSFSSPHVRGDAKELL